MTLMDVRDYLAMDDAALLAACDAHTYKSSGPGGQHRNKVSSAVRLLHRPSGISAHGDDSRSQHENRVMALHRLRMNLACQLRTSIDPQAAVPDFVAECIFTPRGKAAPVKRRLEIGRKDFRFWRVAGYLLDVLESLEGDIAAAARSLGIGTTNFVSVLQSDRHLLGAAQQIRKLHGRGPIL